MDLESKRLAARGLLKNATKRAGDGVVGTSCANHHNSQTLDHTHRSSLWTERLLRAVNANFPHCYHLVESINLVGLLTCIFVKEHLKISRSVHHFASTTVSTGLNGTYGNKGGIVCRMCFDNSSFCFVNAHLPAHQDKVGKRNVDAMTILRSSVLPVVADIDSLGVNFVHGGDGSQVLDHENCFFFGDLNYRFVVLWDFYLLAISALHFSPSFDLILFAVLIGGWTWAYMEAALLFHPQCPQLIASV